MVDPISPWITSKARALPRSSERARCRLEEPPSALVDPCIKTLNDYEDGVLSTFGSPNQWNGGLASQNFDILRNLEPYPDRDGDQTGSKGLFRAAANSAITS